MSTETWVKLYMVVFFIVGGCFLIAVDWKILAGVVLLAWAHNLEYHWKKKVGSKS